MVALKVIVVAAIVLILIGWGRWLEFGRRCCRRRRRKRQAVVGVATVGKLQRNRRNPLSDTEVMTQHELANYMVYHGDAETYVEAREIIKSAIGDGALTPIRRDNG